MSHYFSRILSHCPESYQAPLATTWALFPKPPVFREGRKFGEMMAPVESTRPDTSFPEEAEEPQRSGEEAKMFAGFSLLPKSSQGSKCS